jgi:exodeoxyribonuclease V gamma subunit
MLKLYQSNRMEYLADLLIEITRPPPADPFIAETVVVQHPGMGRWLSLQIAERTGVCANFQFPLPAGFIWELFGRLIPGLPKQDLYAPSVMQWSLFSLLQKTGDEQLFEPVNHYLKRAGEHGAFELAARLAICFDQYLVYRPDWIRAWESGRSVVGNDGWQAELWRRLRRTLNTDHWVDLQLRLERELDRNDALKGLLPERISLFGIPALSGGYLALLQRLSGWMDVHLFLLNPCEQHWSGIIDPAERSGRELAGDSGALYLETGNPLLASLGRQGRDFLAALLELNPATIDLFEEAGCATLLEQLQTDILTLRDGTRSARRMVEDNDGSIRIHSCHGPMREVEVLRDQLLDLFERHPGLQPDQVLVMTPDMDLYAPYIETVFGGVAGSVHIPFSVADRDGTSECPLTAAFLRLLEIPGGRYESSELLSLLEVPAIRRRFSIGDGDLARIHRWVGQSGIRWGQDAASRRDRGLPETDQNSWRAGLDRMLLGFALPGEEERLFKGVLPYDQIEGVESSVLSGLSSFVNSIFELQRQLAGHHRLDLWGVRLFSLIARFFQPEGE